MSQTGTADGSLPGTVPGLIAEVDLVRLSMGKDDRCVAHAGTPLHDFLWRHTVTWPCASKNGGWSLCKLQHAVSWTYTQRSFLESRCMCPGGSHVQWQRKWSVFSCVPFERRPYDPVLLSRRVSVANDIMQIDTAWRLEIQPPDALYRRLSACWSTHIDPSTPVCYGELQYCMLVNAFTDGEGRSAKDLVGEDCPQSLEVPPHTCGATGKYACVWSWRLPVFAVQPCLY